MEAILKMEVTVGKGIRVAVCTSTARVSRCLRKPGEGRGAIEVGGTRASATAAVSRFVRDQPSPY